MDIGSFLWFSAVAIASIQVLFITFNVLTLGKVDSPLSYSSFESEEWWILTLCINFLVIGLLTSYSTESHSIGLLLMVGVGSIHHICTMVSIRKYQDKTNQKFFN